MNGSNSTVPALLSSLRYPSLGPLIKLAPPFHPLLDVLGVETETRPQVPDRIPPFPLAKKEPSISSCLPPHLTFVYAHPRSPPFLLLHSFSRSFHLFSRPTSCLFFPSPRGSITEPCGPLFSSSGYPSRRRSLEPFYQQPLLFILKGPFARFSTISATQPRESARNSPSLPTTAPSKRDSLKRCFCRQSSDLSELISGRQRKEPDVHTLVIPTCFLEFVRDQSYCERIRYKPGTICC